MLVSEKRITSPLLIASSVRKIHEIESHLGNHESSFSFSPTSKSLGHRAAKFEIHLSELINQTQMIFLHFRQVKLKIFKPDRLKNLSRILSVNYLFFGIQKRLN